MLNSDSPLWEDSNKLNLVKIRLLGMEKLVIEGLTLYIWKSILYRMLIFDSRFLHT